MRTARCTLLCAALTGAGAYPTAPVVRAKGRRHAIAAAAAAALPALLRGVPPARAEETISVYFGAGCFWHVQHELTLEEVSVLGRSNNAITTVTGYAGGRAGAPAGKVCYHNRKNIADYGSLGHAEAVEMRIPASKLPAFAKKYFSLFGQRGYRHDPQDAGGEYRSVLGLKGGQDSPYFEAVRSAAAASPMSLIAGVGDEPDTLGAKAVLVYDSDKFPFYPAELYHQFHNDFAGAPYGAAYNKLADSLEAAGVLKSTGCPEPPKQASMFDF